MANLASLQEFIRKCVNAFRVIGVRNLLKDDVIAFFISRDICIINLVGIFANMNLPHDLNFLDYLDLGREILVCL